MPEAALSRDAAAPPAPRLFTRPAAAASCVAFVLIGMVQALYGPAVPGLRDTYGLSPAGAGLGLSLHFTGGVVGVLAFNAIHARISNRALLAASYTLLAAGTAGFALARDWPLALLAAFLGGLGFGGIDYGLNQLFAVGFGARSTAMLNILNAHFGIGAVLGPALVAWLGPDDYATAFGVCAVLSAVLVLATGGVRDAPRPEPGATGRLPSPQRGLVSRVLAGFLVLYILNVAVEAGVGGWEPTHLETVGYGVTFAASATSVYWLMMTVGRFLVVPLTLRYAPEIILTVCAAGMTGCLLLALVPGAAPYAYAGVGLFIAPVFPTGLPWLSRALPGAERAGAWVIAASMVGGVAAPPLLGVGIEGSGIHAVPWLLAALSAVSLAATVWLKRATGSGRVPV
ncbi:sugar MFS transporter [Streptomyces sp. VRA16 Mangrove soil]|uniref:MFS transporter n=1 Tax=Streptomyces sp. VRA16 Mangrove soil TaxID=2817434 RepID=UPI001A9D33A5|nr:MFS transporter [Streptomyces sp. VRA16 Mangrove soil]MBO1338000.1 MFS transporter [Streptomyces sp. VRA16 Mangrove soil]